MHDNVWGREPKKANKFADFSIHNCGSVGHIEDIAVAKEKQGLKLGLRIIHALDWIATQKGCYKVCFISKFIQYIY